MVSEQHTGSYVMQPGKSLGKTQEIAKLLKPVPQWTNITIRDLLIYIYIYMGETTYLPIFIIWLPFNTYHLLKDNLDAMSVAVRFPTSELSVTINKGKPHQCNIKKYLNGRRALSMFM